MKISLTFPVRGAVLCLLGVTLLVCGVSVVADGLNYFVKPTPWWIGELHRLFNIHEESNVPTWWSTVLLLLAAVMLAAIASNYSAARARFARHWWFLATVFVFLSMDEAAMIHEIFITPVRAWLPDSGVFRYGWTLPYLAGLVVLGLAYVRFLQHLPQTTRLLIVGAAAIYIGAAVGLEMVEGWWAIFSEREGRPDPVNFLLTTAEESMEMLGMVLFFYTLASFSAQPIPASALAKPAAVAQRSVKRSSDPVTA